MAFHAGELTHDGDAAQMVRPDWRRWARVKRVVFERDGWRCVRCGGPGRLEGHHIVALRAGGAAYDPANVETLCRDCHIAHHRPDDMTPGRARVAGLRE